MIAPVAVPPDSIFSSLRSLTISYRSILQERRLMLYLLVPLLAISRPKLLQSAL